jgi:hypothetical protein
MNFFGHALVAQRNEATRGQLRAEFVLGAMLPDFATMLASRPPQVTSPDVGEGLAFHHRTDDAFHGAPSFLEFSRRASSFLGERGLSRGSVRAVAHVGVELLLDGAFARESAANEAYLSALDCGLTDRVSSHIHWQSSDDSERFRQLCLTLRARGAFRTDASAEVVAARLRNILSSRPRLAMDDAGESVVTEWVVTARPMIVAGAERLLNEVEQRLAVTNR